MSSDPQVQDVHTTSAPASHLVSETSHVLFLDIVGFTKRKASMQRQILEALVKIVIHSSAFQEAKACHQLIALPTGDGMALVFLSHEGSGPATSCAEEIAIAIARHNEGCEGAGTLDVRMGLHSGNVILIDDINGHPNVAGEGINTAQRVMDCGDANHILLSKFAKHLLPPEPDRSDQLTELGEVRVKHDERIELFSLSYSGVGKADVPQKILAQKHEEERKLLARKHEEEKRRILKVAAFAIAVIMLMVAGAIILRFMRGDTAPPRPSLAILPFKPSGKATENSTIISTGLMEQVIQSLGTYVELKPQSDVDAALKGAQPSPSPEVVARDLNVRYVLRGFADANAENSLENADTPDFLVDISVELYEVGKKEPLFKKNYPREQFKELMMLPRTVADDAAAAMGIPMQQPSKANEKSYAKNAKAFWNYLRGRYWWSYRPSQEPNWAAAKNATDKAIESYKAAIKSDQDYSLAYSGLADAYIQMGGITNDPLISKKAALDNAALALDADPDLAPAYASIGMVKCWFDRDFLMAKVSFSRAIERDNKYVTSYRWYSACLSFINDTEGAESEIEKAEGLEPNNLRVRVTHAQNYYFSRQFRSAINLLERVVQQDPDSSVANRFLALAYAQDQQWDKALDSIRKAAGPKNDKDDSDVLGGRGYIEAAMGHSRDALTDASTLEDLRKKYLSDPENTRYVSPYNIAAIYAEISGQESRAFKLLDDAIKGGDPRISWLKVDPRFERLRQARKDDFHKRLQDAHLADLTAMNNN